MNIEKDIPIPPTRSNPESGLSRLRAIMRQLRVGESFVWPHGTSLPYEAAKTVGIRITKRKLDAKGWRIWRRA